MANQSDLAGHPFQDADLDNDTYNNDQTTFEYVGDIWNLCTHLTKFFLCLVNISASIFLAVVIMKFKKLRTRTNMFLFHYCLNNALYYLLLPILFIIFSIVGVRYNRTIYCCLDTFDNISLTLVFVFAGIAAADCYTIYLKESLSFFYTRMYKYMILIPYIFGILKLLTGITFCLTDNRHLKHHVLVVTFLLSLTVMNVLNIYEYRKRKLNRQERIRYPLIIANIILYCWLPLFVYDIFDMYVLPPEYFYEHFGRAVLLFTEFIPQFLAHGHAIIVVYMLGRLNKNFKMAYTISLKRKLRDYEYNDLDQSEEEYTIHHEVNACKVVEPDRHSVDTDENFTEITLHGQVSGNQLSKL